MEEETNLLCKKFTSLPARELLHNVHVYEKDGTTMVEFHVDFLHIDDRLQLYPDWTGGSHKPLPPFLSFPFPFPLPVPFPFPFPFPLPLPSFSFLFFLPSSFFFHAFLPLSTRLSFLQAFRSGGILRNHLSSR